MKKAFTLIEITVVIVLVSIFAGFIYVNLSSYWYKASLTKAYSFYDSLRGGALFNLASEWKLDEINSGVTPDSWGDYEATLYGSSGSNNLPQLITERCAVNNCLDFDGSDDYIDTGMNLSGNKTVMLWAKSDTANQASFLLFGAQSPDTDSRYYIGFDASGNLGIGIGSSGWGNEANGYKIDTKWHLYVLVSNGTTHTIYVDGDALGTKTGVSMTSTDDYYMGANNYYAGVQNFFDGEIDDVSIYNKALASEEIQEIYYSNINKYLSKN